MAEITLATHVNRITCIAAGQLIVNLIGAALRAGYFDRSRSDLRWRRGRRIRIDRPHDVRVSLSAVRVPQPRQRLDRLIVLVHPQIHIRKDLAVHD